jgi:3'-phosphoadenosine 5'-phosphosulfate (PAPS) 3'-phosphatase
MSLAKSSTHIIENSKGPKLGMVAHPYNTSIWEAESGGQLWVSRKQNQELVLQGKSIKVPNQIL